MNKEQIFNDRFLMIRKLTQNLRKYGSFEPAGFYGRPTHGTGENITYMSKANFLRVGAYLKPDSPKNPHYISKMEALSLSLGIKKDARPLYLEHWNKVGNDYSVVLEPYYNVEDTIGESDRINNLKGVSTPHHTLADFQSLSAFIGSDNLSLNADNFEKNTSALFTDIVNVAENIGHDTISAKLFAHLVLKTYKLTPDYSQNPIYTDSEIDAFESNPQELLTAITRATNLYTQYPALKVALKEVQQTANTKDEEEIEVEENTETKAPQPVHVEQVKETETNRMTIKDWLQKKYSYSNPQNFKNYTLTFDELYAGLESGESFNSLCNISSDKMPLFFNDIIMQLATSKGTNTAKLFHMIQRNEKNNAFLGDNFTDSGLFKDLVITCDFTDTPLKDTAGTYYPGEISLDGDRAYEFLARLIEMDKKFFDKPEEYIHFDGKNRISLGFHGCAYNNGSSFRVDLGYLEFGNKKTVADALLYRLTLTKRTLLTNDILADMTINQDYPDVMTRPTLDEFRASLKEDIQEMATLLEPFRTAEEKFLELHPKFKEINHLDATPYIYICPKDKLTNDVKDCVIDYIPNDQLKDYCLLPTGIDFKHSVKALATYSDTQKADLPSDALNIHSSLPESLVAFSSHHHPSSMNNTKTHQPLPCLFAIPASHIAKLQKLTTFKVTDNIKPYGIGDKRVQEEYQGLIGIKKLIELKEEDENTFRSICSDNLFTPHYNAAHELSVSFGDNELWKQNTIEGDGKLAELNMLSSASPDLLESLSIAGKYARSYFTHELSQNLPLPHEHFPSMKTSLKTWMDGTHEPYIPKKGSYEYYKESLVSFMRFACIDPKNDSLEKQCDAALKRIIDTGRTTNHIKTMIKNFEQFNPTISATMGNMINSREIKDYIKDKEKSADKGR